MKKHYKRVLTIAGSDSGGGAGIQADIKTISACGCYAMSAITAITVQNTVGVTGVYPVSLEALSGQISAVLDDIGADAVKIGMLHSSDVIKTVTQTLEKYDIENIVLDPVMVATSGDILLQDEAIETLRKVLIPVVRIITPNIPEAEILLGRKINSQEALPDAAKELSMNRKISVLLKAGHLTESELVDVFYNAEEDTVLTLRSKRRNTKNTHGTGCTLSSAIASFLALGLPLNEALGKAKEYISGAIVSGEGYTLGRGHGPVHHFFKYWE
ncbi:MAG: bifunctional hydroxymethylpyrimidine kinase/phosphomethylpyrimidine kinase [Bacteroidales bacterium]|nr:bifunctional hydroxymethylpyrimidine kinase/phosphomethylpyrimidine kinase [Bacteroidales bacterium]MBN2762202.1 bifunctional hydroxymethylpyrimidine kinase/phosphomethylpyrimidine kinase [Bacteroidales bacterium]